MKPPAAFSTPAAAEPDFLLHLEAPKEEVSRAALGSVLVHVVGMLVLLNVRFEATPPRHFRSVEIVRQVTPLVAPLDVIRELTQKAPNTKEASKEVDLQSLLPRKEVKAPPAQAALSPRPNPGIPAPSTLPAAPQIPPPVTQTAQLPPPGTGMSNQAPPPPQIQTPVEKPKITFESVPGTGHSQGNVAGGQNTPRVTIPAVPRNTVDEAVARVARRPGGGLVVGDDADIAPSLGESLSQQSAPGKMGSSLELLSDPQGADMRPYLIKVLASVRRNWFAVIPESARLGRRGRVMIQFAIARDGKVPKLVIAVPSGAEPLDRAAVAGISASNPFPPLPSEFRGDIIRLQLAFTYNGQASLR